MLSRLLPAARGGGSVVVPNRTNLLGLINGASSSAYIYALGPIASTDGGATWTTGSSALISAGSGWESSFVKDPCIVNDGTQFACYYAGNNGSSFQVGRATAPYSSSASWNGATWTKYGSNPILGLPGSGWRGSGALFPFVLYDATDSPTWRMWCAGVDGSGVTTIGYLSSSDGLTWTDHGQVLNVGSAGDQDETACVTPCAMKVGSTWYVYYAGYKSSTGFQKPMVATCTDPSNSATYTKLGVLSGFSGQFDVGGWHWRSLYVRYVYPYANGYRALFSIFNPGGTSGGPTDTEEGAFVVDGTDPVTFNAPTALMIPLDDGSWKANSAENPTAIFYP